ncbi:hypothetical protein [Brachyspira murdochii]|uniref:Lipoprotein n=1 Tax=Brachyspira murdochii TaxID=84378 RepID=A0ABX5B538_9SPIR|nr:hypothetical protein [Brachyspira murdochii]PPS21427.1 hypothetical protein DJ52_10910 [Brachyspira murdochii]
MKNKILSIISLLILISLFAISCGDKKGTDPTPPTPNKGIQTYQGNWKVEGKDASGQTVSGTINISSDGTITGNVQGIIGEGQSITKDKITDKGNETYEITMMEQDGFKQVFECTFTSDKAAEWKIKQYGTGVPADGIVAGQGTLTKQ